MKKSTLLISALALALLQACGGDGGGDSSVVTPLPPGPEPQPQPQPPTDEGGVSALFVPASDRVYQITFSSLGFSIGAFIGDFKQAPNGAMFRESMLGAIVTKNIAGDANYALGRWVGGTVSTGTAAETGPSFQLCRFGGNCDLVSTVVDYPYTDVTYRCKEDIGNGKDTCTITEHYRELEDDGLSIAYAVYNMPARFPASGAYACAMQSSTTPIRMDGPSGGAGGSSGGAVKLSFDNAGAHLTGAMTVTVGAETGTIDVSKLLVSPGDLGSVPSPPSAPAEFMGDGTGVVTGVADAGNGGYALMVPYAVKLPSGALYASIARLGCAAD